MNIMFFCIPAHGHHNPTFPVVAALVKRGNSVRYYSFEPFRRQITQTGAVFIACDGYLPALSQKEEEAIQQVSTTEMTITDLRTTMAMDDFLGQEVRSFSPHVIVSDSVCFWGKLTARKYRIPLVVSTTTFAFNQYSAQYMKSSPAEILDLIRGSGRVKAELKKLESCGYHEKSVMPLVQSDNSTDTIVYATGRFQPCSEAFSKHFAFVGPSVFSVALPQKAPETPLVYISLGTVINDRPDFYRSCIRALQNEAVKVVISCGRAVDPASLGPLPENVEVQPYVDQLEVLSRAHVFITHCGMNSVSESLYMATPMVLFPQTNEQWAVARRTKELGAGILLKRDDPDGIRAAVRRVLENRAYSAGALACSEDFRRAPGAAGAADFIEGAPHLMPEEDRQNRLRLLVPGILQLVFWLIATAGILLLPRYIPWLRWWGLAIAANFIFAPFKRWSDRLGFPRR